MSLTDIPVIGELVELAKTLPPEAVSWLVKLVRDALSSDDPARYIQRRAEADAAHEAAQHAVDEALKRGV